jgi:hypothetical protein
VAGGFEAEFAAWSVSQGARIYFKPRACLHHLKEVARGIRTCGEHVTTWRPDHAVGAYYYSLRSGKFGEFIARPCRAVPTRYHLQHPWQISAKLVAKAGGMLWALALYLRSPKRLGTTNQRGVA